MTLAERHVLVRAAAVPPVAHADPVLVGTKVLVAEVAGQPAADEVLGRPARPPSVRPFDAPPVGVAGHVVGRVAPGVAGLGRPFRRETRLAAVAPLGPADGASAHGGRLFLLLVPHRRVVRVGRGGVVVKVAA